MQDIKTLNFSMKKIPWDQKEKKKTTEERQHQKKK